MKKKKLIISRILLCTVVCLSAPSLWANILVEPTAPTDVLTREQILSEFDPMMLEHLLFSEIHMTMADFHFGGADITKPPEGTGAGEKGPAIIFDFDLPNTFLESQFVLTDHLITIVLGGPAGENLTVDEALGRALRADSEFREKAERSQESHDIAKEAKKALQQAIDDAMNAEPGSEEAKEAAWRVEEATKAVKFTEEQADREAKEANEAMEKYNKAMDDLNNARERAAQEAEKQNKAAGEAAEKAYKETGTAPAVESTQPSVSAKSPDPVDEALGRALRAESEFREKAERSQESHDIAKEAAKDLSKAIQDAMDAEPGSEEAKEAARRVEDAAKAADHTEKQAQKEAKEANEAMEKYDKAMDDLTKARAKAAAGAGTNNGTKP